MHGLLKNRVKPYYLYQCDPISGSAHFRTGVDKGLAIIRALRGHTTGYATPIFTASTRRAARAAEFNWLPIRWPAATAISCC